MQQILTRFGYPIVVGILLGLLQSGLFFLLTFTVSSGFSTYLLITLCWLMGGILGALYVNHLNLSLNFLLFMMLLTYALTSGLVNANPFNTQLWPIYEFFIGLAGIYPGVFFGRASKRYAVRSLFFWENNGFIMGLIISSLSFMLFGRSALWILTFVFALIVWFLSLEERNTFSQAVNNNH